MRLGHASIPAILALILSLPPLARAQPATPPPPIGPKADALLKQMGEQLAAAKRFTFETHSMVDQSLDNGQKVQIARNQKIAVRRPDGAAATVAGDIEDLRFGYDGKKVTLLNLRTNTVGAADPPPTRDAT